jgi:hypothetical protein
VRLGKILSAPRSSGYEPVLRTEDIEYHDVEPFPKRGRDRRGERNPGERARRRDPPGPGDLAGRRRPGQRLRRALPWPPQPDETPGGHRPGRKAGALVILADGELILASAGQGT